MFKRNFFFGKAGMLSRVLCMSVFLLTLLSCNEKEEVRPLSGEGESAEEMVTIGAGVSLRTKATDAGFEMGDTLGIYLCKWKSASEKEELLALGNYADNAMFRLRSLPDRWESDKAYYYPAGNQISTLDISGCTALMNLSISNNPLVFDLNALTALASSLPDRNGKEWQGDMYIDKSELGDSIRPMCEAKNWELHE